jgi:hypothetical protein
LGFGFSGTTSAVGRPAIVAAIHSPKARAGSACIQVVTTALQARSELQSKIKSVISALSSALQIDVIKMTKPAEKPLFHVSLSDRDDWVVVAEWPDGTLEQVSAFKNYSAAAHWIATASEAWLYAPDDSNPRGG